MEEVRVHPVEGAEYSLGEPGLIEVADAIATIMNDSMGPDIQIVRQRSESAFFSDDPRCRCL